MVRALVVTHGSIGAELVKVVGLILGSVDGLDAGTNSGKSAVELSAEITAWLDSSPEPALIMVDDYAGSCATSAQLSCGKAVVAEHSQTAVICGVNLAMLLGFATWRESCDYEELVRKIVQKGREAITRVGCS